MIVFISHAGLSWLIPGSFGVTVFFFLSGFLITTLLRMEVEKTGGINLRAFYLRRVLRIFPPMYLVLAMAVILTIAGVLDGSFHLHTLLAQAFHLTNYYIVHAGWWDGIVPGTWVYWSLAVEEHFYLVFPLFYLALWRVLPSARLQMVALLALCAFVLAWRLILVFWLDAARDRTYVATDTRVDSILFGCVLAVYGNPMLDPTRISERWWKAFWLPLGLVLILVSFVIRAQPFQETIRYTLQGLALIPLFVVAVRYPEWPLCRLLNVGWVRFVGLLSYSLYLLHPTAIYGVHQWVPVPAPIQGLLALGICLLLASGIYYLVEKPSARLRGRLSRIDSGQRSPARRPAPALATISPAAVQPALASSSATAHEASATPGAEPPLLPARM